jgi:hypothetical protein
MSECRLHRGEKKITLFVTIHSLADYIYTASTPIAIHVTL